jgi:hypothetical protein
MSLPVSSARKARSCRAGTDSQSQLTASPKTNRTSRTLPLALTPLLAACATLVALLACNAPAASAACPNEALRTGRSASLPDCRTYELVTPEELGRTEDLTFLQGQDHAVVSNDGERVALDAKGAFLEPRAGVEPSDFGTNAVFSRTPSGWTMTSLTAPGMAGDKFEIEHRGLLSPDFSQVALSSYSAVNPITHEALSPGPGELDVGPIGGPYTTVASVPARGEGSSFSGANAGTPGVPASSDVLFVSVDHALLAPGLERERAEETNSEAKDLYEWSGGRLRLVNVDSEGKLLNKCGAELGRSEAFEEGAALNAVSADGSRVLFSSPEDGSSGCGQPALYMRVDRAETVEVSAPEGISVSSERGKVAFDGASADGRRVFFTSENALTPEAGAGPYLYEYDSEKETGDELRLIANGVSRTTVPQINPAVVVSGDGSVVYFAKGDGIFRYDAGTGQTSFVATHEQTPLEDEPMYATPDGRFLVFPSGGNGTPGPLVPGPGGSPVEESRGARHDELYRYDANEGTVMCVSCGEGVAPAKGHFIIPHPSTTLLGTDDSQRVPVSISEDGRRVFFETSARLVPQDTNESTAEEEATQLGVGADTYEWEAFGTEEAPGVFCRAALGCTHLISAGESVGPEDFLGASANGQDVFFVSAAQLVPQATPEFANIYDARVDGGFPSPSRSVECTSCQGVGSPPPQFTAGSSLTFAGAGNPPAASNASTPNPKPKPKSRCRRGFRRSRHGKCLRATRKASAHR